MQPRMSEAELQLFESFLRCAVSYIEFGCGGSTLMAAKLVAGSVTSVDSDMHWIADVQKACAEASTAVKPDLHCVDIGPTGEWGCPTDETTRSRWPTYHRSLDALETVGIADLFLVDGRFRVACFMQIALRAYPSTIIMLHDFRSRPQYHVVRSVAREIAVAEDMSVFQILPDSSHEAARLLVDYEYDVR